MSSAEPKSPFRSRGFIAAAIVIGVIVLAAIIVLVGGLFRDDNDTAPAPTPTTTATPTIDEADVSICGLPGHDTENTLTAAPNNDWELVGTVAAPTDSDGAGPGVVEETFRTCFAHTAEGALFAAVNAIAASTDSRNAPRMWELLADGPAKDTVQASGSNSGTAPSNARLQVAGFKVNNYTSDEATIDLALSVTSEGGALVSYPTVLRWEDGDWKVVLTENGAPIAPGPLTNLGGYLVWAGV